MTDFNDNSRYEFIKKLNENDRFDNYHFICDRGGNAISSLVLISIGIVMGMVLITAIKSCDKEPELATVKIDCRQCHAPIALTYKQYVKNLRMRENYDRQIMSDMVRP